MEHTIHWDDGYYTGNDLLDQNERVILKKVNEAIKQQTWGIATIFSLKEKNDQKLKIHTKKIDELKAQQAPENQIQWRENKYSTINNTQGSILQIIRPIFNQLFDEIADDPALWTLGYNEKLRTSVWLHVIFGYRTPPQQIDGSRDQYRYKIAANNQEAKYEKQLQEKNEQIKIAKEKVPLPMDHILLNEQSYPELKTTLLAHIDTRVDMYQKRFLKDTKDISELTVLIDNYFLFIFLQTLIQSKVVFDIKKPRSNPFFEQVLADCLLHIQEKYGITLTLSSDTLKKKFFSKADETSKPLDLMYKNCTEVDLIQWEKYLNTYFFTPKKTSVDSIRRRIMFDRNQNNKRMDNYREMLNPLYHLAKEKKEKILKTIEILEKDISDDIIIHDMLKLLQENLVKAQEDMKNTMVFEEDPIKSKNPESMIKVEQQYLRWYQVPVQYRKMFGVVINRLNHFHQVKANVVKKANKNNERMLDQLIDSDQTTEDTIHYLNKLITTKYVSAYFDEKWHKKQEEKFQIVQSFCKGTRKIQNSMKHKEIPTWQIALEFYIDSIWLFD